MATMCRLSDVTKVGVLMVLAFLAVSCESRGVWTKDGLTQAQLRSDQKACVRESGQYGFLAGTSQTTPSGIGSSSVSGIDQADLYRMCMRSHGYKKVRSSEQD